MTTREAAYDVLFQSYMSVSRKTSRRKFIFAHLQGIRVEFIYEGPRVTFKVMGATTAEDSYFGNIQHRLAITPVL